MFSNKAFVILGHAAGWILFYSFIVVFIISNPENNAGNVFGFNFLVFYLLYIFLFYLNSALLIPELYLRKNYIIYFTIVALLLAAVFILRPFDSLHAMGRPHGAGEFRRPLPHDEGHRRGPAIDIISLVLFIMIFSFSAAMKIIQQWRITEQRATRAEADKANAELSFLKAQINPHFLFNTLNNIYSLAVTKSDSAPDSILKLSNIMRYVTDEVNQDFVSLESEVECIRDYIDLQRLRLSDKANVNFTVAGSMAGKQIAPLILMTFIENVFKYGTSNHEPADINIGLVAAQNQVSFNCKNKIFNLNEKLERTGIGIENTRQRLNHLYGNKHSLLITTEDGFYNVQLTLKV